MPVPMPPIINERGKEIDNRSGGPIAEVISQAKDRRMIEPAIPSLAGNERDAELNRVDKNDSSPPRINARQFHRGPQSFGQNTTGGDPKNDEHVHVQMFATPLIIALIDNALRHYRFN
jgi:hypothetical protein